MINKINFFLSRLEEYLVALLLAFMTVVVFLQVIYRYVLNLPQAWAEDLAKLSIIWLTFLGVCIVTKHGDHIVMPLVLEKFSPRGRRVINLVNNILILIFLAVVIQTGIKMTMLTSGSVTPVYGIRMSYYHAAIPFSGLIMFIRYLIQTIKLIGIRGSHVSNCSSSNAAGENY